MTVAIVVERGLFKEVPERPPGYHILTSWPLALSPSGKAVKFRYHGWRLWLPTKSIRTTWPVTEFFCPGAVINWSKTLESAEHGDE